MREVQIHKAVAEYLSLALQPPTFWTTFPAGGGGMIRGRQLKGMGLKAGIPDIMVVHDGRVLWIELKAPNKYPDPNQRAVHAILKTSGCEVCVLRSVVEVEMALFHWGVPLRARSAA